MITAKLSQQQFDTLAEELRAQGIDFKGTSGTVEKDGGKVGWSFLGEKLTLECLHAPFPFSKSFVENKLKDALVAHQVTPE